jgi:hypothetical protein
MEICVFQFSEEADIVPLFNHKMHYKKEANDFREDNRHIRGLGHYPYVRGLEDCSKLHLKQTML